MQLVQAMVTSLSLYAQGFRHLKSLERPLMNETFTLLSAEERGVYFSYELYWLQLKSFYYLNYLIILIAQSDKLVTIACTS